MRQIINALPPSTFSSKEKRSRPKLDEAVMRLPPEQRALLEQIAIANVRGLNNMSNAEDVDDGQSINSEDNFMETVSEDCCQKCISNFIDAMGNNTLATSICAVCAGSFFNSEIYKFKVSDLQDVTLLQERSPDVG